MIRFRCTALWVAYALASTILAGCDRDPTAQETPTRETPAPVASVSFASDSMYLLVGDSVRLEVVLRDSAGSVVEGRPITWSAQPDANSEVRYSAPRDVRPSVDSTGLVRAHGWGSALVIARSEGKADTIAVLTEPRSEGHLQWSWGRVPKLSVGASFLLYGETRVNGNAVKLRPTPWDPTEPRWSSSHPAVIALDTAKFITGIPYFRLSARSAGRSVVTMTFGGATLQDTILVEEAVTYVHQDSVGRCGIRSGGEVWCKGDNQYGQLGTLTAQVCVRDCWQQESTVPIQARTDFAAQALTAGSGHECALSTEGIAYCWGDNQLGQLGTATGKEYCRNAYSERHPCSFVPVAVSGGLRFRSITARDAYTTCGITSDEKTYCWGGNVGPVPILQG